MLTRTRDSGVCASRSAKDTLKIGRSAKPCGSKYLLAPKLWRSVEHALRNFDLPPLRLGRQRIIRNHRLVNANRHLEPADYQALSVFWIRFELGNFILVCLI